MILNRNSRLIYIIRFLWGLILIQSVMVPFYMQRNISEDNILLITAFMMLFVFFLEIPTGFLADTFGPNKAVIIGSVCRALGAFILVIAYSVYAMILAYFFIALANTLISGSDLSLLYKESKGDETSQKQSLKTLHIAIYLGGFVSTILGAAIANFISLDAAITANFIVASLPIIFSFLLKQPKKPIKHKPFQKQMILKNLMLYGKYTLENKKNFSNNIYFIIISNIYSICFYIFPIIWYKMEVKPIQYGIFFLCSNALNVLISSYLNKSYIQTIIKVIPIVFITSATIFFILNTNENLAFFTSIFSIIIFIIFMPVVNVYTNTLLKHQINIDMPEDSRATINSIMTFSANVLCIIGIFIFKFTSLFSLVTLPIFILGLCFVLFMGTFYIIKKNGDRHV